MYTFGNIKDYSINKNDVVINYDNYKVYVKVISDSIINFFSPVYREERNSKAVENLIEENVDFNVCEKDNSIIIKTKELIVKIYDEFKVDIYDINENIICSDYRGKKEHFIRRSGDYELAEAEGHKVAADDEFKIYISKTMEDNMYFY